MNYLKNDVPLTPLAYLSNAGNSMVPVFGNIDDLNKIQQGNQATGVLVAPGITIDMFSEISYKGEKRVINNFAGLKWVFVPLDVDNNISCKVFSSHNTEVESMYIYKSGNQLSKGQTVTFSDDGTQSTT